LFWAGLKGPVPGMYESHIPEEESYLEEES
jgi:hypothetical protein